MARLTAEGLVLSPWECAALEPVLRAGARELRLVGRLPDAVLSLAQEVVAGAATRAADREIVAADRETGGLLTCVQIALRLGVGTRRAQQLVKLVEPEPIAVGPRGQRLVPAGTLEKIKELRGR